MKAYGVFAALFALAAFIDGSSAIPTQRMSVLSKKINVAQSRASLIQRSELENTSDLAAESSKKSAKAKSKAHSHSHSKAKTEKAKAKVETKKAAKAGLHSKSKVESKTSEAPEVLLPVVDMEPDSTPVPPQPVLKEDPTEAPTDAPTEKPTKAPKKEPACKCLKGQNGGTDEASECNCDEHALEEGRVECDKCDKDPFAVPAGFPSVIAPDENLISSAQIHADLGITPQHTVIVHEQPYHPTEPITEYIDNDYVEYVPQDDPFIKRLIKADIETAAVSTGTTEAATEAPTEAPTSNPAELIHAAAAADAAHALANAEHVAEHTEGVEAQVVVDMNSPGHQELAQVEKAAEAIKQQIDVKLKEIHAQESFVSEAANHMEAYQQQLLSLQGAMGSQRDLVKNLFDKKQRLHDDLVALKLQETVKESEQNLALLHDRLAKTDVNAATELEANHINSLNALKDALARLSQAPQPAPVDPQHAAATNIAVNNAQQAVDEHAMALDTDGTLLASGEPLSAEDAQSLSAEQASTDSLTEDASAEEKELQSLEDDEAALQAAAESQAADTLTAEKSEELTEAADASANISEGLSMDLDAPVTHMKNIHSRAEELRREIEAIGAAGDIKTDKDLLDIIPPNADLRILSDDTDHEDLLSSLDSAEMPRVARQQLEDAVMNLDTAEPDALDSMDFSSLRDNFRDQHTPKDDIAAASDAVSGISDITAKAFSLENPDAVSLPGQDDDDDDEDAASNLADTIASAQAAVRNAPSADISNLVGHQSPLMDDSDFDEDD